MNDMNTICFWLIKQAIDSGAEEMTIQQKNVHNAQGEQGDWEIIVRKKNNE